MSNRHGHYDCDFDTSRTGTRYLPHEKEYIVMAYDKGYSVYAIAEAVKRSPGGVRMIIKDAGYEDIVMNGSISAGRRWTPDDDAYLRENINLLTWDDMAFELDRTVFAVKAHAHDLGLKKRGEDLGQEQG